MKPLKEIIKQNMLPISMLTGAAIYLLYHYLPEPVHHAGPVLAQTLAIVQPLLIFAMLFLTFCRIEPRELRPHRWHWWLLLIQGASFTLLGLAIVCLSRLFHGDIFSCKVLMESAMLCLICPTATAAAVVTRKLGGDIPGITTYTILINILAAALVPAVVPLVNPMDGMTFWDAFCKILAKVFPLLIMPCLCAWLVRYLLPSFHKAILSKPDLAFNIWAVSLSLAIAVTVKSIVHSTMPIYLMILMALVSLVCCALQFALGHWVGSHYGHRPGHHDKRVTAGQALGQKNTVFAIWMGYTFMTPETSIVGGFYSIWHNLYNSWQLGRQSSENQ
ncbi:MAG: bile acid:sodium symporter family protein [Candidatus Cryptobacteroides sp.]